MPRFLDARIRLHFAFVVATVASARACGPDFPNAYLAEGSVSLLSSPEGYFAAEIAQLVPPENPTAESDRNAALLAAASAAKRDGELTETGVLRVALARRGDTPKNIAALAAELERARAAISAKDWKRFPTFSALMPAEFSLYLNGAAAYWKGDHPTAEKHWKSLLALPAGERRHYTVNAAYMLGRLLIPDESVEDFRARRRPSAEARRAMPEGVQWLRRARAAAVEFYDISDLASASIGWEARAHFLNGDYAQAIRLYLEQGYVQSLRIVSREIFHFDGLEERLRALVSDESSRRVLTLYLLSQLGWDFFDGEDRGNQHMQSRIWAGVLAEAGLRDVPDTDRLAWLAYQAGFFELAEKWLQSASDESVSANWIRAKLALRSGEAVQAGRLLEKVTASPELAGAARPAAWADLGRVRMGRGNFAGALDAFLRGCHWEDAAYIAERVLTPGELVAFVDEKCPRYVADAGAQFDESDDGDKVCNAHNNLRHLLARRLARENRAEDAGKYFPEAIGRHYTAYIDDTRAGFGGARPTEERAKAFWRAAVNVRENGMEMLGAELAPDYFIWGGNFESNRIHDERRGAVRLEGGLGAPTPDELKRLDDFTMPQKRFHYRYRAAELGWWAASLMPNDSDETARMLNTAGGWLKNRDPKAANRFYQALCIRCPNTALGKAAAAKKWFPDDPKNGTSPARVLTN